jgi:hypothetical protein
MTPDQANQFLVDYGPFVWFVVLTLGTVTIFVKSWPFFTSVVKTVEIITELPDRFHKIDEKLDTLEIRLISVEEEVKTNGGSSIKDAVRRIEDRLDTL